MINYISPTGTIVSYPTAERSEVKDGVRHFYDQNDNEVGSHAEVEHETEPTIEVEVPVELKVEPNVHITLSGIEVKP